MFNTVKTDPGADYLSQGLKPGVYRGFARELARSRGVDHQCADQGESNRLSSMFDFKPTWLTGNTARSGKQMVWMPGRTGTHLGGNWVQVDDEAQAYSDSNIRTYSVRKKE